MRRKPASRATAAALRAAALGLVVSTAWQTASAHHSISGVYDGSKRETIEGFVVEFRFVSPHPFLIVRSGGEDSASETWALEMDNRFELARIGIDAETFMPGDRVIAAGSPGREEGRRLYVRRLDRPADGLRYEQVGSRPRINLDEL